MWEQGKVQEKESALVPRAQLELRPGPAAVEDHLW